MSDYEFEEYKEAFTKAATKFGWKRHSYKEYHERDERSSWTVYGWANDKDEWLINDSALSEPMVQALIELAGRLSD